MEEKFFPKSSRLVQKQWLSHSSNLQENICSEENLFVAASSSLHMKERKQGCLSESLFVSIYFSVCLMGLKDKPV